MISVKDIRDSFLHLMFPHVCFGCGSDIIDRQMLLCLRCLHDLPETNFASYKGNPVEKIFWGRLPVEGATAQYYFTKGSMIQRLMHQFKYKGAQELGLMLGRLMGEQIRKCERFPADALLPLPLFPGRERVRGYNQSDILCDGMSESLRIPVLKKAVSRPNFTETQTRKGRIERWKNIEGKFIVTDPEAIRDRHLLVVDDVVTTGATLESCGNELLKVNGVRLSIASLCISSH